MSYQVDAIRHVKVTEVNVPLAAPVSDAKVLQGKQKALAGVFVLCVEITTHSGTQGAGFSYALRAGGMSQYALAQEFAPLMIGEDPNDIQRLWDKLSWAGNTLGENGLINQVIAAFDIALWDLKARKADLPLAKLIGANRTGVPCYNTSGGYLQAPIDEVIAKAKWSLAHGMGGIKLKVGQPDAAIDIARVKALRNALGPNVPLMVDANQQWDLSTALRVGHALDAFNLTWLEEPLNAHDVAGHRKLKNALTTPIGTGEMLSSLSDVLDFIDQDAVDLIMPDAPRLGGITPLLAVLEHAREKRLTVAPHFVMSLHLPLAATYPYPIWVEHVEWLQPLFNEDVVIADGLMQVPTTPGLGITFNQAKMAEFGLATATY
ncbi:L-talarate/galactarate dehydratase [Lacticaseibacillus suihuaensis]